MRRDYGRLEESLTREYVSRAEKLKGLSERHGELEWLDVVLWATLGLVLALWLVINF